MKQSPWPKKILVVDDEEEVLYFLSNILKRANYEVVCTSKGAEVLEIAKNIGPDLIILDVVMPDMSGDEVALALSEDSATNNIPIIFLTGLLSKREEFFKGKVAGKHYVIAKPITAKEILQIIGKVLSS